MKCAICEVEIENREQVVVERGLQNLMQASKDRGDEKHTIFEVLGKVPLHKTCRKNYTRKSSIASANKENTRPRSPQASAVLRSEAKGFNFHSDCVFCGETASVPDSKLPKNRRLDVCNVATVEFRAKVLSICKQRSDEWGNEVDLRIANTIDLVAKQCRYHKDCYKRFMRIAKKELPGRPEDSDACSAFKKLCEYIESNDECQYSLSELKKIMIEVSHVRQEDCYSDHWLKSKLLSHYGSKVMCTELHSLHNIFSFSQTGQKILTEKWYRDRNTDNSSERLRIVQMAAKIIKEDICRTVYDCSIYPNNDDIKDGGKHLVPATLEAFTNIVTATKTSPTPENVVRKRTFINHSIIAASRPRSFISPLHIGLSVHLYRCYGSRHLIDVLHSVGACCSYAEATNYVNCAVNSPQPTVDPSSFLQFVFDNADVNTRTLDGLGTFHALGGIKCVTPEKAVSKCPPLPRIVGEKCDITSNQIPIIPYKKPPTSGLQKIIIKDLGNDSRDADTIENADTIEDADTIRKLLKVNMLWLVGFMKVENEIPSWSGYMRSAVNTGTWEVSRVLAVPFINLEPGNLTTLYSALTFAAKQSQLHNQVCVVTFDQPLFWKSIDIVESSPAGTIVSDIVVRLGGFHLLMSFLGSVGYIMSGSGIEELWQIVYGKATVPHMMAGKAYARAVRAHILTAAALFSLIHDDIVSKSEESLDVLSEIVRQFFANVITENDVFECTALERYLNIFEKAKEELERSGRTAKLWLQYFDQIILMLNFLRAERTGDWKLHIKVVKGMLPHFHSSGHLHYAKCAHLYVQRMEDLCNKLSPEDFQRFTEEGYCSVRRSNRFWSGVSTDMCIEQILMRSFKAIGGLTHGRGISDSTLQRWVLSASACVEISEALTEFTGVSTTNDQHSPETSKPRQLRDSKDFVKFVAWIKEHNPFHQLSGQLVNLSNGLVADESITCDSAVEIGTETMKSLSGMNFADVRMERRKKVVPLSKLTSGTLKVRNKDVILHSQQQLFHRMICLDKDKSELKAYFHYELATVPPSLFDSELLLRKGNKSSLVNAFKSEKDNFHLPSNTHYVLDGGNLLHCVVWPKPTTFGHILDSYTNYVESHYGKNCTVVFDGYPDRQSTKSAEQQRRAQSRNSRDVIFNDNTSTTIPKSDFLANKNNKRAIIASLVQKMRTKGYTVLQAESDADTLIVTAALDQIKLKNPTVVIGQDTDLLVLLTALAHTDVKELWFMRPGKCNTSPTTFNIQKEKQNMGETCEVLLLAHAITGCDTTSAFYKKGKVRGLKLLQKHKELRDGMKPFYQQDSTKEAVKAAGEKFILKLYGSNSKSLDELRYFMYNRIVANKKLDTSFHLASLPPTSAAAEQHSYRVYFQIQEWLGNSFDPTEWGWCMKSGSLRPVPTTKEAAPTELLHLISCNCKQGCTNRCKCVRSGLLCSAMCGQCEGTTCSNSPVETELDDVDD